ncbi:PEP-CTERM sorting domain-containing protein [Marinimicrobium agarilyticum]|uniref:PEP-CTERM sorting domain-containing protein n=1 Tax=Marinimicrobium agarilyticum TaxID=306546 RepID=UPI000412FE66|nr:PEP-CTERM sorting domain-containing protein [Marinimicrobium agarilyticum]
MKTIQVLRLAMTAGLLTLAAAATQAATIKLTYQNNLSSEGAPTGNIYDGWSSQRVYAGEFDFSTSENTTGIAEWDDGLSAFCVQIDTTLKSPKTYNVTSGLGAFSATQATYIDRLFSNYYDEAQSTVQYSAAFQLALWEVVEEYSWKPLNLSYHHFEADWFGGAKATAQGWLNSLTDNSLVTGVYDFHYLENSYSQNLLTVTKASVPEPTSLLLFATGLLALFRVRRRTR